MYILAFSYHVCTIGSEVQILQKVIGVRLLNVCTVEFKCHEAQASEEHDT